MRKIDELVCIHVMGHKMPAPMTYAEAYKEEGGRSSCFQVRREGWVANVDFGTVKKSKLDDEYVDWEPDAEYSTSIEAAWEVVEKMRADDWLVTVKCNTDAAQFVIEGSRSEYDAPCSDRPVGPKGSCVCELNCMRSCKDITANWRHSEFAIQPTAPLAVCVGALKAANVPESEITAAMEDK